MYGQFGHVPSGRFASPGLDPSTQQIGMLFIPNYSVQCFFPASEMDFVQTVNVYVFHCP